MGGREGRGDDGLGTRAGRGSGRGLRRGAAWRTRGCLGRWGNGGPDQGVGTVSERLGGTKELGLGTRKSIRVRLREVGRRLGRTELMREACGGESREKIGRSGVGKWGAGRGAPRWGEGRHGKLKVEGNRESQATGVRSGSSGQIFARQGKS